MRARRPRRAFSAGSISIPIRWSRPGIMAKAITTMSTWNWRALRPLDVHHNFVQRWNEASERTAGWPMGPGSETIAVPRHGAIAAGDAIVQVQRTVHRGRYADGQATPGGKAFDIAGGERSNLDQYRAAIGAARRSLYMENQHVSVPEIIDDLRGAVQRGVEVVLLVPAASAIPAELRRPPELRDSPWPASPGGAPTAGASPSGCMPLVDGCRKGGRGFVQSAPPFAVR